MLVQPEFWDQRHAQPCLSTTAFYVSNDLNRKVGDTRILIKFLGMNHIIKVKVVLGLTVGVICYFIQQVS